MDRGDRVPTLSEMSVGAYLEAAKKRRKQVDYNSSSEGKKASNSVYLELNI